MNGIISICIFISLAVVAVHCQRREQEPSCPEFNSRYEGENLIISLNEGCDMVVGTLDITGLSGMVAGVPNTGSGLVTSVRGLHIPTVTYRRPQNIWDIVRPEMSRQVCPPFTVRYLGPRVVLDTVPNTCQKVVGVRTFQAMITGEGSEGRQGMMMVTRAMFENPTRRL
ncbi:uncharacterized protein LOC110442786 [Mizuhopecten yessoensis]|uniref:uncharacterized protein LOC110442786 n=1 Tax=Mizuhopecten yessoensis TaxID=6573 RepID=UPI000B459EAF|nr:uncharacterized protein LOC110442786 [Mizuhopecten yessoensis]